MRALCRLSGACAACQLQWVRQAVYPTGQSNDRAPGAASAVDVAARIVTQKMADNMGQQFVIMNQPGASGMIGAEQVEGRPDATRSGFQRQHHDHGAEPAVQMRWIS